MNICLDVFVYDLALEACSHPDWHKILQPLPHLDNVPACHENVQGTFRPTLHLLQHIEEFTGIIAFVQRVQDNEGAWS